ncbi:MAG: hypothetical protein QXF01_02055 [Candidatus Micrarchaeaceae archaeon]
MDESDLLKKYNSLYLEIIMKYKDYIEEQESLYVAELPKLVTPADESVKGLAALILSKFQDYNYEKDFYEASRLSYEFVKESIKTVTLPIQFWLKPSLTINHGAGDLFDKAVLLCSLLISLGNPSAKIIIVVGENRRSVVVYFELNGKIIAMDLEKGVSSFGIKEELLKALRIGSDDATAYEFNDRMYNDIA